MKKILAVLVVCAFVFGGAVASYAKELKLGYVDLDKVFEEYYKTKDAYRSMDSKLKGKEAERKKMVDEVRRLKDELELLSDKGKEEKQNAIDEKIAALNEFDNKAKDELKKERIESIRTISGEIDAVIQDYGKGQGFDLILASRSLVFGKDEFDVTDAVVKILNAKAPAGSAQAAGKGKQ
ncbi:MAG: OmpH family outer membrane protein [Candidatus Omnitrophica bacterium]|nr:OmpH family outer membrane protein [Candidatus Omnitrophota bacterium]